MKALRKPLSLFMAMLMCLGIFAGTGTTAFAAGETMTTYMVEFPRASDPNKAGWGHSAMNFLGGWSTGENNGFTIHTQDSFNGKVIYCIEPGVSVHSGDQFTGRGEDFWDDYPSDLNPTIPPDTIKEYIGRIMTYGWQGNASTSWMTDDPEDASKMAGARETKAPEGFLLDENAYYVEITENGKIYEVENEAGIGFTNMAQTGSLRIEKTSSDGKVEGFSFRVTGANGYDQTFKTDKNGEIFIEGLRVGDYTVSEVSDGASANYVLPADKKVTILADKTTVAQMHNELRDTPKTGDDSKPWLWAALMGVSAMGAAALGVAAYVGKRKKDNHTAK